MSESKLPELIQRATELAASSPKGEEPALAKTLAGLFEEHELAPGQMGEVVGTATANWTVERADQLVWSDLANIQLVYLCDFFDVCQSQKLGELCGGFITARMRNLGEDVQGGGRDAKWQGTAFGATWTIRLTGEPLVYGYADMSDITLFARYMVDAVMAGSPAEKATEALRRKVVEHMIARVGADRGPKLKAEWLGPVGRGDGTEGTLGCA